MEQKWLPISFTNPKLLEQALTHKSYSTQVDDYEKLELLGDSVLNLVILEKLMKAFPNDSEGDLSRKRAALVNQSFLSQMALQMGVEKSIRVGTPEKKMGMQKRPSILAAVLEAVFGAVYIDQGFDSVRFLVDAWFGPFINSANTLSFDFKTQLQEKAQELFKVTPSYRLLASKAQRGRTLFQVGVFLRERCLAKAVGSNKKEAEQKAAKKALAMLKENKTGLL
ncbi:MAG: ribonuclease III [Bdellovibrionaceae bacterium]|nr:ribonuclease III [Pseudobdellovibrionaceae bacterium]MDW8189605.1 ribonuclease III [Pseudobdellovibrionaceae bacterium]